MAITLKAARVNKGLTQKEAAKLIGISEPSLVNYEAGKTFPNVPTIKKIEEENSSSNGSSVHSCSPSEAGSVPIVISAVSLQP